MVTQINPTGGSLIPLVATSTIPVASARPATAPAVTAPAVTAPTQQAGSDTAAVARVNEHLQQSQPDLKLQLDAASGRTVFQVIQQGTGQVLLQVPSAEVLGMSRRIRDMAGQDASGALVDKES